MKENIILVIKGFIIGLAKVIPGVSGSLLAITLGIYEKAIEAICNFFKDVKRNIMFLGTVGIGVILAIAFGSKLISYLLLKFYLPTMFLFIGLIAGTVPNIIEESKITTRKDFIIIIISFLLIYLLSQVVPTHTFEPKNNLISFISILIFGFIDAATMIIPGISGTAIFILLGCYSFILDLFGNITNLNYVFSHFGYYIFLSIGLLLGVIIVTHLINYLLKKQKSVIYSIIIGFSLSSILILLNTTLNVNFTFMELMIAILLSITGYKVTKKFA